MKLRISSLGAPLIDESVRSVRAVDESGAFGILPRHVDLVSVLAVDVVSWTREDGSTGHCAVKGGVLDVRDGDIAIAAREAHCDDDLRRLEATVLAAYRRRDDAEREARIGTHALEFRAVRQILQCLDPALPPGTLGGGA